MTNLEALLTGTAGASSSVAAGGRRAGGDWRQAVEQAQAEAWLRDRNLAPGPGHPPAATQDDAPAPASRQMPEPDAVPVLPTVVAATPVSPAAGHVRDSMPPIAQASVVVRGPAAAFAATPAPRLPASANALASAGSAAAQSAVIGQGEAFRAARVRKQSIHSEIDERGVSVWIRDASLNSHEAMHLAAAMAAAASSGRQGLISLYLNGRPVAGGLESSFFPPSE